MSTIPSLALLPSGYKASKVYSVLPSDGTGDFDFSRSGNATRVNKDGLIELVGSNIPRLNYPMIDGVVSGCPSLLLEPSRTNLITFSEDFTEGVWGKTNTTVISNDTISPDGTLNASRLTDNTTDGLHVLGDGTSFESGETYTATIFAKKGTASRIFVGAGNPATWGADCYFDLENGTVALESIGTASIEDYGNGWYRCTVVGNANADAATNALFGLADNSNDKTYIGSGDYVYFWGAQLEAGSYATSYIPTQGSIGTRVAETASKANISNLINSSEGVLYFESKINAQGTYTGITLSDNSTNNEIIVRFTTTDRIEYYLRSGGSQPIGGGTTAFDTDEYVKVAFAYKSGDSAFYVNGTQVTTSTTTTMPVSLSSLKFSRGNGAGVFDGKTKDLRVYNTRLSNTELAELTKI